MPGIEPGPPGCKPGILATGPHGSIELCIWYIFIFNGLNALSYRRLGNFMEFNKFIQHHGFKYLPRPNDLEFLWDFLNCMMLVWPRYIVKNIINRDWHKEIRCIPPLLSLSSYHNMIQSNESVVGKIRCE